ncbi:DUF4381 domain-containing protein [Neptunicella sp. SCSIO 80796]|uniref:DUF4381 domain-containing protein n=1 Tax=Neptunicella plasticusilytica TaxID=3117012 RepID=UPI003A4DD05C
MNPLEQLKDIHLPAQVGAWPPAWGWWLLAVVLLTLIALTTRWLVRRYRKKQAIREAMVLLAQLDQQDKNYPQQLNSLLKRLSLSYFPRINIARLHQQDWLAFLSRQLPARKQHEFESGYQMLLNTLYDPNAEKLDHQQARTLVQGWIKAALPPNKQEVTHV